MSLRVHNEDHLVVISTANDVVAHLQANRATAEAALDTGAAVVTDAPAEIAERDEVELNGRNLTSATVTLGGVAQTVDTSSYSRVRFTADLSTLAMQEDAALTVSNEGGSNSVQVDLVPSEGNTYVVVSGYPPPEGQLSLFPPEIEDGDQCEHSILTDQGDAVTVNPDGTFNVDGDDEDGYSFDVRLFDVSASEWGPWARVRVNMYGVIAELQAAPANASVSLDQPAVITVNAVAGPASSSAEIEIASEPLEGSIITAALQAGPATAEASLQGSPALTAQSVTVTPFISAPGRLWLPRGEAGGEWLDR